MALDREVAAVDRVEEVEADREILLEIFSAVSENLAIAVRHQETERYFEQRVVMFEHDAVLEGHQLVRPSHVRRLAVEAPDVVAQVGAAPDAGCEPRPDAETAAAHPPQAFAQGVAAHERVGVDALLVDDPVDAGDQRPLVGVEDRPVDEITAFVGLPGVHAACRADVEGRSGRHAELKFVLGQVDIHERGFPVRQRGTAAVEDGDVRLCVGGESLQGRTVEEVDQQQVGHAAEDRILLAHERGDQRVDLLLALQRPGYGNGRYLPALRFEGADQRLDEFLPQDAFVTVDDDAFFCGDPLCEHLDPAEYLISDFECRVEFVFTRRCFGRLDGGQETV